MEETKCDKKKPHTNCIIVLGGVTTWYSLLKQLALTVKLYVTSENALRLKKNHKIHRPYSIQ